ncbi:RNA-binding protein [Pseudoalteromonas atlantica]|uniref:RNA-binding protein n=1 Tax=Pseudoalteromonas atlantica TaxID=288 RepID=UPI003735F948
MQMFLIVVLFILSLPFTSQASTVVYKCDIKGVTTFSQFPCAKDAKEITIKAANVAQVNQQEKQASTSAVESYLELQRIDREITQHHHSIKQLEQSFAKRKKQIGYITQDSANRMGATSIANAIDIRTRQLKNQIDPQIDDLKQKVETLKAKKEDLQSKAGL